MKSKDLKSRTMSWGGSLRTQQQDPRICTSRRNCVRSRKEFPNCRNKIKNCYETILSFVLKRVSLWLRMLPKMIIFTVLMSLSPGIMIWEKLLPKVEMMTPVKQILMAPIIYNWETHRDSLFKKVLKLAQMVMMGTLILETILRKTDTVFLICLNPDILILKAIQDSVPVRELTLMKKLLWETRSLSSDRVEWSLKSPISR